MKNWHIGMREKQEDLEPNVEQTASQTAAAAGGTKIPETVVIKASKLLQGFYCWVTSLRGDLDSEAYPRIRWHSLRRI